MLETRVVEDELWWELRHWEVMRRDRARTGKDTDVRPEPTSAWLFNSITNKHADAMDNFPEPVVLPESRATSRAPRPSPPSSRWCWSTTTSSRRTRTTGGRN